MMQIILSFALKDTSIDYTGKLDEKTKETLINFQKNNQIPETGYFDLTTQDKLTNKIFPDYTANRKSEEKTSDSKKTTNPNVIENPGVKVRSFPSDLEQRFKNIPGVDFDKFKNDIESVGIPVKYAIRQIYVESAFSPDVISCKRKSTSGAMGLAQFMPTTWPSYGKGGDPCKVPDALAAYVRLMADLVKKFPGRLDLAFAGYNSGPNLKAYASALKNDTVFNDLKGKIPNESYGYASSILQA
jgi:hypothetical protein